MNLKVKNTALLLLLSGTGSRFKNPVPKQFIRIPQKNTKDEKEENSTPLFSTTIRNLIHGVSFSHSILAVHKDYLESKLFAAPYSLLQKEFPKIHWSCVAGGKSRHHSFLAAAKKCFEVTGENTSLLIHDANRPNLSAPYLSRIQEHINKLNSSTPCFIPVIPVSDSICTLDNENNQNPDSSKVLSYAQRGELSRIQTPQLLHGPTTHSLITKGTAKSRQPDYPGKNKDYTDDFTDEGSFLLASGHPVYTFEGDPGNIKITYPEDAK